MKRVMTPLIFAAMLFVPWAGAAQVTGHVSMSLGVGPWVGFGLSSGIGLGFSLHHDDYYHDDYRFGVYESLWTRPFHCRDPFWYDPFQPCHGYFAVGWPVYDYWGWHSPWRFGFVGWPSHRYVRSHWWNSPFWTHRYSPFWADRYAWGYGGFGRWGWRYGYDRGYGYDRHDRIVRRSPLYGPRYKEYPAPPVYVTDNGPERPVSRAVPRLADGDGYFDGRAGRRTDGARTARPQSGTDIRTARPRTGADARTSRRARPRVGTRPEPTPRRRIEPPKREPPKARSVPSSRRPAPIVRSAPSSRRPAPIARPTPSRRSSPTARPTPSRRPSPTVRSAPSRIPTPRLRSAPSRRPAPKARPTRTRPAPKARAAPSRAPKPKVRPAPRGSGSRKAPPRRPARRPGA